ncbi:MAG TPA: prepilin-type N-terminal cleavage/methylation domain-containing protein [Firmicutes bacterium]|nr:prepilin-type N-terminal cleavage/methylation domain-containing protein [Bacillota bacterium]
MFRLIRRAKKEEGFTLVELMVVIIILGALVAIAVPMYTGSKKDAVEKACQANLRTLEGAIAQYRAVNGAYPVNLAALVPDFIKAVPKCPENQDSYGYDNTNGKVTCPNNHTLP